MKIGVFGLGYVGLSNALLLGQKHEIYAFDIDNQKINLLQHNQSPIKDKEIEDMLESHKSHVIFTDNQSEVIEQCDLFLIATPTNYDVECQSFDTKSIESIFDSVLKVKKHARFIIKSTIPIGYVDRMREKYQTDNIIFSPEFLREGQALYDNLYPQRIIVGDHSAFADKVIHLFKECAHLDDVPSIKMGTKEAESVKLFSNTYLAMRVAYFNELDNFAMKYDLNTQEIIQGMGYDQRIGHHYNNPSFGFGGYCLPKDTKQLRDEFKEVPESLISAIIRSNELRTDVIVQDILKQNPKSIGIYRLSMKQNSDNWRMSSIIDVMKKLAAQTKVTIYEPQYQDETFEGIPVVQDFEQFIAQNQCIVTNRMSEELEPYQSKVYTRDIYNRD